MQATNATKPTLVPGLTLHVDAGDRDRFARLFRSTWLQIPNEDRRRMTAVFRRDRTRLELMDGWSNWWPGLNGNVGIIGSALNEIRFHAPYIDRMTDGSVAFLIAHELAHVRQFCLGKIGPRMKQALERDADAHARQWLKVSRCPPRSRAMRE